MPTCEVCDQQDAKYRCPRCGARACSSKCSQQHKVAKNCSGQRDKTAYIPPNQYGYGALMDDYVFLEQVGRQLQTSASAVKMPSQKQQQQAGFAKHFRQKLDIHVVLLDAGMERRRLNQSRWRQATNEFFLTLTFVIMPLNEQVTIHQNAAHLSLSELFEKAIRSGRFSKLVPKPKLTQLLEANSNHKIQFLHQMLTDPRQVQYAPPPRPERQTHAPVDVPDVPDVPLPAPHPSLPAKPAFLNAVPARLPLPTTQPSPPVGVASPAPATLPRKPGLIKRPLEPDATPVMPMDLLPTPSTSASTSTLPQPTNDSEEAREAKRARLEAASKPKYQRLDCREPLASQLRGHVVIEWPIIYVWLPEDLEEELGKNKIVVLEPPVKDVAPSVPAGQKASTSQALSGLVSYGSDSEASSASEDALVEQELLM